MSNRAVTILFVVLATAALLFSIYQTQVISHAAGRLVPSERPPAEQRSARARLSPRLIKNDDLFENEYPSSEQLVAILRAIENGTPEALQVLRPEFLELLPRYEEMVVPLVRRHVLVNLLARFQKSDWRAWHRSAFSAEGGVTEARAYADRIAVVNTELGRYVDTAGHLFTGLYQATARGNAYSLREDYVRLVADAEEVFSARRRVGGNPLEFIEPKITEDQGFLQVLEKTRGMVVVSYIRNNPDKIFSQVRLLDSLNPAYSEQEVYDAFVELLNRLSLGASAKFRAEILEDERFNRAAKNFAQLDDGVANELAQFYSVAAADALVERNQPLAEHWYRRSLEIRKGLPTQKLIAKHLKLSSETQAREPSEELSEKASQETPKPEPVTESTKPVEPALLASRAEPQEKKSSEFDLFAGEDMNLSSSAATPKKKARQQSSGGSVSWLFITLLVLFLFGSLLAFILYRRRRSVVHIPKYEPGGGVHVAETEHYSDPGPTQFATESAVEVVE